MPGPATVLLPGIDLSPPGGIFFALPLTEPRKNGHILSYLRPPAGACLHRCCAWLIMPLFVCLFVWKGFIHYVVQVILEPLILLPPTSRVLGLQVFATLPGL